MPSLTVQVLSPQKTLYSGSAQALTSFNQTGRFDILPQHANFICIIKDKIILHLAKGQSKQIDVQQGILHCQANQVRIFIGVTARALAQADVSNSPNSQ